MRLIVCSDLHGDRSTLGLSRRQEVASALMEARDYAVEVETRRNNMRSNRKLTFNGETKNATQWARVLGLRASLVLARMRRGLPPEEVLRCAS